MVAPTIRLSAAGSATRRIRTSRLCRAARANARDLSRSRPVKPRTSACSKVELVLRSLFLVLQGRPESPKRCHITVQPFKFRCEYGPFAAKQAP
jgi:hypothetical protein